MEIPVIHEQSNTVSTKPATSCTFSSSLNRKNDSNHVSSTTTSSSLLGYVRSHTTPFPSANVFTNLSSSLDGIADHHLSSSLTNRVPEKHRMTLEGFNANSDPMTMLMMNDDLTGFNYNNNNNNNNNNNISGDPQGFRSLHARLPSTDSGIQADAGFDSLSRYKGKHLVSSTNAAAAAATASNAFTGTKALPDDVHSATTLNPSLQSTFSPAQTSPNDSISSTQTSPSPHGVSSSGYESDVGVSSPTSASSSSPTSSFPHSSRTSTLASTPSALDSNSRSLDSVLVSALPGAKSNLAPSKPTQRNRRDEIHSVFPSFPPDSNSSHRPSDLNPVPTGKAIQRQSSVPAVAPKPRVSLSRKPAFIGRGGNTAKQTNYSGGGGGVRGLGAGGDDVSDKPVNITPNTGAESLSLSRGIKVVKNEDGVEVRIPTKPTVPSKNSQIINSGRKNDSSETYHNNNQSIPNSQQGDRSSANHTRLKTAISDSHNSSIDILTPDGSSVKIQVVKPGLPSFSPPTSISSSLSSLSSSSSPSSQSDTKTNPKTSVACKSNQTTTTAAAPVSNVHLTRPLRLAMLNSKSPTAVTSTTSPSSSSTSNISGTTPTPSKALPKAPNPKWRSHTATPAISDPLTMKTLAATSNQPYLHHLQERKASPEDRSITKEKENINSSNNQNELTPVSAKSDCLKAVHHIPIKTISGSHSAAKPPPNPSLYTNSRNGVKEHTSYRSSDYSKTTPISVITNSDRSNYKNDVTRAGSDNSVTSSSSTVIMSSPPPAIVMSPPPLPQSSPPLSPSPPSSNSQRVTSPTAIDSCIFRFKSPEASVFKQTFYEKNKAGVSPSSSFSSSPLSPSHQRHESQPQPHHLRPNYLPTPNRADLLRKNSKPGGSSAKNPEVIMRQTDDIFREALEFFNSRDDEDWDKLFTKAGFSQDGTDDMEKIFSKYWKTQDDEEFDRLFHKVFKRRNGSLEVNPRVGVSVDDDIDEIRDKKFTGVTNYNGKVRSRDEVYSGENSGEVSKTRIDSGGKDRRHNTENFEKSKESESRRKSTSSSESWNDTKQRIDSALSRLLHGLADLRAMDKSIVSQFRRCQDTIESLQAQREVWEGLEEETEFWDDMEISEFNRRCQESPGSSSLSPMSTGSRDITMATSDAMWNAVRNGGSVIQDVEATL